MGIIFDHASKSDNKLSHVEIKKADSAILVIESRVVVENCRIKDSEYGLVFQGASTSAQVQKNRLLGNKVGISSLDGAEVILQDNIIEDSEEEGIVVESGPGLDINGNKFTNNPIDLRRLPAP